MLLISLVSLHRQTHKTMRVQLEAPNSFSFTRNNVIQFPLAFGVGARVGINIRRELYNAQQAIQHGPNAGILPRRGCALILIHEA